MATLKEIRDRKATVQSINKITSALKLVSTAKSQRRLNELRIYTPFYNKLNSILHSVASEIKYKFNFQNEKTIWLVFTSDLGLAGGFNSLLIKQFLPNFNFEKDEAIVFGNKGKQLISSKIALSKLTNFSFYRLDEFLKITNQEFLDNLLKKISNEKFNFKIISNNYINQITSQTKITNILPLDEDFLLDNDNEKISSQIIFEPSINSIIEDLLKFYVSSSINYFYKNSLTAEESSRRNAMENASSNSDDMLKELSKEFNRIRQSKITQEISELLSNS